MRVLRKKTLGIVLIAALVGCGGQGAPEPEENPNGPAKGKADDSATSDEGALIADRLERFESVADFDAYVQDLIDNAPTRRGWGGWDGPVLSTNEAAPAAESITNNQEAGVDEGDIVKAHGDHLVILRRGRLFTVEVGDSSLTPVSFTDAFPPGSKLGTWYDEMLIHGDTIVVVGYSYKVSATEIGLFSIDAQGQLAHKNTYFLRSNDYYSSRNYASRLVDGKLVFYMPYFLLRSVWADGQYSYEASLPGLHPWPLPEIPEESDGWQTIIDKTTIYRPIQKVALPALHTIVTCDLNQADFGCEAQGILGPYSRTFYVSKNAVYLWVNGMRRHIYVPFIGNGDDGAEAPEVVPPEEPDAVVYRLPLSGGSPGAVRAGGNPTDQFSFKERAGQLHVLVRAWGGGDWMWQPELSAGAVGLARIPVSAFSSMVRPVTSSRYTTLSESVEGYTFQNRFVGDHVVYGTGSGWWNAEGDNKAFTYSYINGGSVGEVALSHSVDRIEVMGEAAVIVGRAGSDLHFSALELGSNPRVADTHIEIDAVQGETRSHGFFYKGYSKTQGILGLPVREQGQGWYSLFSGSARVLFLGVVNNRFYPLGSLDAQPQDAVDDQCVVSCVDWYGNARPIFFQDRIFGLLGYELVEGELVFPAAEIVEIARADVSTLLR